MENINVHPVIAQAGNQPVAVLPGQELAGLIRQCGTHLLQILIVEGNENDVIQPAESVDQAGHGIGFLLRENALQLQHAVLLVLLAYADVIFQICQPQIIPSLSAVGVKQHDLAEAVPRQPLHAEILSGDALQIPIMIDDKMPVVGAIDVGLDAEIRTVASRDKGGCGILTLQPRQSPVCYHPCALIVKFLCIHP